MILTVKNRNKARDLREMVAFLESLINNTVLGNFDVLRNALMRNMIDLNKSLIANVEMLFAAVNNEMKCTLDYMEALKIKKRILLSCTTEEKTNIYFNTSLKQILLNRKLHPYEEVKLTKALLKDSNFTEQQILDLLHEQFDNIINGGMNFGIVNSLDAIDIDPKFLQNDAKYNDMVDYLIDAYLTKFDKHKKKNSQLNIVSRYIIRLLYRHLNRGFYIPDIRTKESIVYAYSYNAWYGDLKSMINNDKLKLLKGEDIILAAKVADGLAGFYANYGDVTPKEEYWKRHYLTLEVQDLLSTKLEEKMILARTLKED